MAKQTINIGASANDGSGDPIRNAFDKTNDNFNELYFALGGNSVTTLFDVNGNFDFPNKPHKIAFYYATEAALFAISASTYKGSLGYAQDTGYLYYSDSSAWIKLAKFSELGSGGGGASANTFGTIAVSGQTSVVADGTTDTLTLIAGSNITLTTDATNDSITIAAAGGGGASAINDLSDVTISSPSNGQVLKWDSTSSAWVNGTDATAGAGTFISLTDTPSSFGSAGQILRINTAGDGIEFATVSAGYSDGDVDTHLNTSTATAGQVLSWTGTDYDWITGGAGGGSSTFAGTTDAIEADINVADIAVQAAATYVVTANGTSAFRFNNFGNSDNPILQLKAGDTIAFDLRGLTGHPFNIETKGGLQVADLIHVADDGTTTTGFSAEGQEDGVLYWKIPSGIGGDDTYKYRCSNHSGMTGRIDIEPDDGKAIRKSTTIQTSSLADGASENIDVTAWWGVGTAYALFTVDVDKACWVRIYCDSASRTADSGRTQGSDPAEGSGVVAEFIATGATTFKVTPAIIGWVDPSEGGTIPITVKNNSGSTGVVTVTTTTLSLEDF